MRCHSVAKKQRPIILSVGTSDAHEIEIKGCQRGVSDAAQVITGAQPRVVYMQEVSVFRLL